MARSAIEGAEEHSLPGFHDNRRSVTRRAARTTCAGMSMNALTKVVKFIRRTSTFYASCFSFHRPLSGKMRANHRKRFQASVVQTM